MSSCYMSGSYMSGCYMPSCYMSGCYMEAVTYTCRYIHFFNFIFLDNISIPMYIMCVCLFSALSRRVGALQISIIIACQAFAWTTCTAFHHRARRQQSNQIFWTENQQGMWVVWTRSLTSGKMYVIVLNMKSDVSENICDWIKSDVNETACEWLHNMKCAVSENACDWLEHEA